MTALFSAQFSQQGAYIVYQRVPFSTGWGKRGDPYIVTVAERDRFIADFTARSPKIMERMIRDIILAFLSLIVTSQIFHAVLGEWATDIELALVLLHVSMIVLVESRRMKELWDAPFAVLKTRAPAPQLVKVPSRWFALWALARDQDLYVGAALGAFLATGYLMVGLKPLADNVSAVYFYGGHALFLVAIAMGAMCTIELARRALRGSDRTK